jgi:hypothetical protein
MYLDEASEIFSYWERNPPVYQMTAIIAQIIGWKPSREAPAAQMPAPAPGCCAAG